MYIEQLVDVKLNVSSNEEGKGILTTDKSRDYCCCSKGEFPGFDLVI